MGAGLLCSLSHMYEEVSRINDGISKGWLVNSSRDGEALEILFSDWECGGKDNACRYRGKPLGLFCRYLPHAAYVSSVRLCISCLSYLSPF